PLRSQRVDHQLRHLASRVLLLSGDQAAVSDDERLEQRSLRREDTRPADATLVGSCRIDKRDLLSRNKAAL
ncbi:MAG: hypothetical protein WAU75_06375, partial [Solirubrobacteraceae bacterium]